MKSLLLIILGLAASTFATIAYSVGAFHSQFEHRFRIRLVVATPEGTKEASSVWSVTCREAPGPLGGCKKLNGQAVFVELGHGKNLAALMALGPLGDTLNNDLAYSVFGNEGVPNGSSWFSYAPSWRGARALNGSKMLTLVSIGDVSDPNSVRVLQSSNFDFKAAFGDGYAFQGLTLEMVPVGTPPFNSLGLSGTPITTGIEARIPFLVTHRKELENVIRNMPPRYQLGLSQFFQQR